MRFVSLLLLLALFACDSGSHASVDASVETTADYASVEVEAPRTAQPPTPPQLRAGNWEAAPEAPKIIYTARVVAEVANLDSALQAVSQRVTAAGGYLSDQRRTNQRYQHNAELTIRLPANRLTSLVGGLPALTVKIDEESLSSDDVTAEWIDLESRLATKRTVRDRYVEILRKRAVKVEDILAAEDKIRVITEEIEAKEGRLRYLRDQVQLSTLHLTLYEQQEYRPDATTYAPGFWSEVGEAFGSGARVLRGLALFVVAAWPLWILLAIAVVLFRRWRR